MPEPSYCVATLLAQATGNDNAPPIVWPWFIIGCVLLLVAIIAFFWGFAAKNLTSSRYSLLMWILPLSSGFAAGAFVGGLKATGPVGTDCRHCDGWFCCLASQLLADP